MLLFFESRGCTREPERFAVSPLTPAGVRETQGAALAGQNPDLGAHDFLYSMGNPSAPEQ